MHKLFFTVAILILAKLVFAQNGDSLLIKITDFDSLPIEGVVVLVNKLDQSVLQSGISNHQGIVKLSSIQFRNNGQLVLSFNHLNFNHLTDTVSINDIISVPLQVRLENALHNMDPTVVTGQYSASTVENSIHQVTVINREQIENMAAVNLEDVLVNNVNMRVSQDNVLGSGMTMQGISGQNVKIMIDGVPVIGRLDGNIDLSQINLNNVDRIEIVQGPLSVKYGTNALAGTINIITNKSKVNNRNIFVTTYYENIGHHNVLLNGQTKFLKTNLRGSMGRNYFDGWNSGDPAFSSYTPTLADSGRFKQWKPKEQLFGRVGLTRTIKGWKSAYRFEIFDENILNRGMPRAPYGETAFDDTYQTWRQDHSIITQKKIKDYQINAVFGHNQFKRVKNTYVKDLTTLNERLSASNSDQDTNQFKQVMSRGSLSGNLSKSKLDFELGYDLSHETAKGKRIESGTGQMGDYALFASVVYSPLKNLLLKPALRLNYNTVYEAPLTPSFNLKWKHKNFALRASYARGFRAPSLKELHFLFIDINHNIVGNTGLEAEQSHNFLINLQSKKLHKKMMFRYSIGAYHNSMQNMITLAQVNSVEYSYVNIGRFQTHGLNANLDLVSETMKVSLGANRLGRLNGQPSPIGQKTNYSSEFSCNVQYRIHKADMMFSTFYKYQGRLQNFYLNSDGEVYQNFINSYHMSDIVLSKGLMKKRLDISIGVKNLFNVQNVLANSNNTNAHSSSSSSISVGTGRTFFGKVVFKVGKL